ncbi:F-box/FBD/LRR-repeat protein At1g13570-like [Solanum lycopersicum]|uniref:FBD domain-containing protein n=1 Tax=Solanum lycopersicum TaxID=4081 RepID=K4BXK9_SOLLC|nr:F-box/FBD/LRR-repeat protein At1g13570-like [Solanum lycopersicum]
MFSKHACQSVPLDVLSSLPDNVIDEILMCLPLREAVRTSILSTKWRYKWCRIPDLKLDYKLWQSKVDKRSVLKKFTKIIYHLVTSHDGPISKFILSIRGLEDSPVLDKLIYFLSRNSVQHLELDISGYYKHKLPSSIFTCLRLMHLSLSGCSIQLAPRNFKGFDTLICLELRNMTISSKILENLISNSPLLDTLMLHQNVYFGIIEINAPKLRAFEFNEMEGSICLKSTPNLQDLTLWHKNYHVGSRNHFKSFYHLEYLVLNGHSLKVLAVAAGEVTTRLPFDLNSLKQLCLDEIYLRELDVVSSAVFLIKSFQHLQILEIQVEDYDNDMSALQCLELEAFSDVKFNHLRKFELSCFTGSDREMQLIKLLLAKSPVLENMRIHPLPDYDNASEKLKNEIPVLLNTLQRASPQVEVVYVFGS